jgi:hypothetical protein
MQDMSGSTKNFDGQARPLVVGIHRVVGGNWSIWPPLGVHIHVLDVYKSIDQGAITQAYDSQSGVHGNMFVTFGCCCVFRGGEGNGKAMCSA